MILPGFDKVRQNLKDVCQEIGCSFEEIHFLVATKYGDAQKIQALLNQGLKHVGENRIQEAGEKFQQIDWAKSKALRHMIGSLQSNKVKKAVELFDVIQSVDRLKLIQDIDTQAEKLNKTIDILLQVNTAFDPNKSGCHPDEVQNLVQAVEKTKYVRLKGLMTLASSPDDEVETRKSFQELKKIYDQLDQEYRDSDQIEMKYLSMGMSGDFKIALEEGSNMIRIGRAVFC